MGRVNIYPTATITAAGGMRPNFTSAGNSSGGGGSGGRVVFVAQTIQTTGFGSRLNLMGGGNGSLTTCKSGASVRAAGWATSSGVGRLTVPCASLPQGTLFAWFWGPQNSAAAVAAVLGTPTDMAMLFGVGPLPPPQLLGRSLRAVQMWTTTPLDITAVPPPMELPPWTTQPIQQNQVAVVLSTAVVQFLNHSVGLLVRRCTAASREKDNGLCRNRASPRFR